MTPRVDHGQVTSAACAVCGSITASIALATNAVMMNRFIAPPSGRYFDRPCASPELNLTVGTELCRLNRVVPMRAPPDGRTDQPLRPLNTNDPVIDGPLIPVLPSSTRWNLAHRGSLR